MQRREFLKFGPAMLVIPTAVSPGAETSPRTVAQEKVLETIPYSLIDSDFMSVLGKTNPSVPQPSAVNSSLRELSLIIRHKGAPGNFWELRLPESFGSLTNPAGTFQYVVRQNWQVSPNGDWGYPGTSWRQYYSNSEPIPVGIVFSGKTKRAGNLVAVELQARNLDPTIQRSIYVWICLMQWFAPSLSAKTLVRVGGRFVPYEHTYPSYFGPAGMRCYTEVGKKEAARLASLDLAATKPPDTPIADPARCMVGKVAGQDFVAGIASPDAAILGGYDTNPCTDAALLISDLGPGETRKAYLGAYFGFGTSEDLWRWYQTTNFADLFRK